VKILPLVIGVLMVVGGAIFTFQGLDYLEGSAMSGSDFWAIVGPIIAGFGVALLFVTFQNRRR
jgi:hypothetical protein